MCRPEILKQEIKVFFVKYNDPIYVKLEKLDIMIRLASQANIAQVPYMKLHGNLGGCFCPQQSRFIVTYFIYLRTQRII